jgi:gliding motility-associated-like protein
MNATKHVSNTSFSEIMKKQLIALTALLATTLGAFAQDLTIADGGTNACGGSLNDSNPFGPYAPNENFTFTLCPELGSGETISNIYFIGFDLGEGDTLRAFDGGSSGDPLIGIYTGSDLLNQNLTSTNAEGCITLVWTSDATDEGDFGAILACGPPCLHPIIDVSITNETENPVKICQGETITFDASQTIFAEGSVLSSATWYFGDGTSETGPWPFVNHTFEDEGAYQIGLIVTDTSGCQNLNVANLFVLVSTTPDFTVSADPAVICQGGEVSLTGAVTAVTYTQETGADIPAPLYIPDSGTQETDCFFDTIWVSGFGPTETINSISDIDSLMVNMEHTFLTDITIAFICPNGSVLSVYGQGGGLGNVDLGFPDPLDDGSPGEGLDYYWSPDATSPDWHNLVAANDLSTVGATDGPNYIISGAYQSVDPFSNFLGCPVNGPWVIRVCDVVGSDDGWVFNWGIKLDPSLFSIDLSFTPVFEGGCTSTFWSGNSVLNNADCTEATGTANTPGNQTFTYSATDDFGCTYTASTSINVIPLPIANAGPEVAYCNDIAQLTGSFTGAVLNQNYTYAWEPANLLNDASIPNPTISGITENTSVTLTVSWDNDPEGCQSTDETLVFIPPVPLAYNDTLVKHCPDGFVTLGVPFQNGPMNYSWEVSADPDFNDPEDVEIATTESVTVRTDSTAYYRVTITDPYCGVTEETYYTVLMKPCSVSAPNVFTPDGDGKNNLLVFPGLEDYPGSKLIIYNRWGTVVYETENYNNKWAPSADDAADGTYFYVLAVNKESGLDYFKGTISLLRKDSNQ